MQHVALPGTMRPALIICGEVRGGAFTMPCSADVLQPGKPSTDDAWQLALWTDCKASFQCTLLACLKKHSFVAVSVLSTQSTHHRNKMGVASAGLYF